NDAIDAFLTGTGLMALHLPGLLSNSTGAWSLGIEVAFYLIFPIVALLSHATSRLKLLLIVALLVVAQMAVLYRLDGLVDGADYWTLYVTPLTFAPFFALGL